MHPAFSVIFFTTLSGLGYGLWMWTALWAPLQRYEPYLGLIGVLAAVVPVTVGLLSSLGHLGKPLRAWRSFSQWRSSWLSREGLLSVATYLPWLAFASLVLPWDFVAPVADSVSAHPTEWLAALGLLSLATVACTAMIYASLKPIPAWRHRAVVPGYIGFALLTGGLATSALQALGPEAPVESWALALLLLAVAMVVLKRRYWRDIDRGDLPSTRASALGLPADRVATVFERPHTEANYLTREMGYVLARKHSRKLRAIALLLFGVVPVLACVAVLLWPPLAAPAFALAALSALLGAMVERWLFFAEARHLVMLYY